MDTSALSPDEETRIWDFLTVVGGSQMEAQACLTEALELQARDSLYATHAQAWAQFWEGCSLDVTGPLALRQALRSSLYYLFSALPHPGTSGPICHGLSPGGLSNGSQGECYWGHVFWDQVCMACTTSCEGLACASLGPRQWLGQHRCWADGEAAWRR